VGELTNTGLEVLVGGYPVRTGNFTWDLSVNIAKNKNKLVELIEDLETYTFSTTNFGNVIVQATVGGEYGEIWGTEHKKTPAGDIVVDATGRPQASEEKVLLGNYQPDVTGGIYNRLTYRGISLGALIDFRIGGEVFSGTDAGLDATGVSTRTLAYRDGITVDGMVLRAQHTSGYRSGLLGCRERYRFQLYLFPDKCPAEGINIDLFLTRKCFR